MAGTALRLRTPGVVGGLFGGLKSALSRGAAQNGTRLVIRSGGKLLLVFLFAVKAGDVLLRRRSRLFLNLHTLVGFFFCFMLVALDLRSHSCMAGLRSLEGFFLHRAALATAISFVVVHRGVDDFLQPSAGERLVHESRRLPLLLLEQVLLRETGRDQLASNLVDGNLAKFFLPIQ